MRINFFSRMHAALGIMLHESAMAIQQADYTDHGQAVELIKKTTVSLELLEAFQQAVAQHFLPLLSEYEPSVAAGLTNAGEKTGIHIYRVRNSIQAIEYASNDVRAEMGLQLVREFRSLVATCFGQFAAAEDAGILIQRYMSDNETRLAEISCMKSLPLHLASSAAEWMLRALNDSSLVDWIHDLQQFGGTAITGMVLRVAGKINNNRTDTVTRALSSLQAA